MAKIGYARVSSADQNLDRQLKQLNDVEKIFKESISGVSRERPQLIAMLDYIRDGDIVVVTELERLGRNNKELTEVMDVIKSKGATLEVLNLPTLRGIEDDNLRRLLNNLILELYKYQAQAERERIKERQARGNIRDVKHYFQLMTADYSMLLVYFFQENQIEMLQN